MLGLLLLFEEYRNAIATQKIELSADDFVTEFNRRVFVSVMQMHERECGFRYELLGEEYSPDEMGRIEKMEVARRELTQNGVDVLTSAIATLRDTKSKAGLKNSDLSAHLAFLREKKGKLHKGKADTQ